jgi:hypothetical protein
MRPEGEGAAFDVSVRLQAYRARSNLSGELRRALDNAVAYELIKSSRDEPNVLEQLRALRDRGAADALGALRTWTDRASGALVDLPAFEGSLVLVDDLLAELPTLAGLRRDDLHIQILVEAVTGIRFEVLRQAQELLEMGFVLPGAPEEPLWDHLTRSTNPIRYRAASRAEQLWRNCEAGSHAVSTDMTAKFHSQQARDLMKPAMEAISKWERQLTTLVKEFNESGKVGAEDFIIASGSICPVISRLRDGLAVGQQDIGPRDIGPRERRLVDLYLRLTATNLGQLLTELPPRDWLIPEGDPNRRLAERIGELTLIGAAPAHSAERVLQLEPGRLTTVWDETRKDALGRLSAESRAKLAKAFDRDLAAELKDFVRSVESGRRPDARELAWRIASIVSDFQARLRALQFGRSGWPDEAQIDRMEEALSAIGEEVKRRLEALIKK